MYCNIVLRYRVTIFAGFETYIRSFFGGSFTTFQRTLTTLIGKVENTMVR